VRSCIEGEQKVPGLKRGHYKSNCEFDAGVKEVKDRTHNQWVRHPVPMELGSGENRKEASSRRTPK
jgi:hypothetical protein